MDLIEFKERYENVPVQESKNKVASNPLVSICIQTYQHAEFIKDCLDGVLNQNTNFDFEILLGEDDSNDGTRRICQEYADKYPDKIRLFLHHRKNNIKIDGKPTGRFSFAYNLYMAKGEYISICEGDDYWTDPNKLQKQIDFLEQNKEYVISFHDVDVVNEKGDILSKGRIKNSNQVRLQEDLVGGSHLPTNTVLFKNILKGFPPAFFEIMNADNFLFAMLGHYGKGYRHFDIKNSVYRRHSGGMWSGEEKLKKFKSKHKTFRSILEIADSIFKRRLLRKLMSLNFNLIKLDSNLFSKFKYGGRFLYYATFYMFNYKN